MPTRQVTAFWGSLVLAGALLALPSAALADYAQAAELYNSGQFAEAYRALAPYAREGNADAQSAVGAMLSEGKGVKTDVAEAVRWLRLSARKGNANAQLRLAVAYAQGAGVPKDRAVMVFWFQEAARNGSAEALAQLKAVHTLSVSPKYLEDADAQTMAGLIEYGGLGVAQDKESAARRFREAARRGHDHAQNNLAAMLARGEGGARDTLQALTWFRRSAEQGDAQSMLNLAALYVSGEGIEASRAEAARWLERAADAKDGAALYLTGVIHREGAGVPVNLTLAAERFRSAAENDEPRGQRALAELHRNGDGLPQNKTEFARWVLRAADNGDADSQRLASLLYRAGYGLEKDQERAIWWFRRATATQAALADRPADQAETGLSLARDLENLMLLDDVGAARNPQLHHERVQHAAKIVRLQRVGISVEAMGFNCQMPAFPASYYDNRSAINSAFALAAQYEQCVGKFVERAKSMTDAQLAPEARLMTQRELSRMAQRQRASVDAALGSIERNAGEIREELDRARLWADNMKMQHAADRAAQEETQRWLSSVASSLEAASQTMKPRAATPIDANEFAARVAESQAQGDGRAPAGASAAHARQGQGDEWQRTALRDEATQKPRVAATSSGSGSGSGSGSAGISGNTSGEEARKAAAEAREGAKAAPALAAKSQNTPIPNAAILTREVRESEGAHTARLEQEARTRSSQEATRMRAETEAAYARGRAIQAAKPKPPGNGGGTIDR